MSLTLILPDRTEAQLREEARRRGVSAEAYAAQLLESFAKSRELQEASESELYGRLGLGFAEEEWKRYYDLVELRQQESLSAAEHQELLALNSRLEGANAKRMGALVELAKRRGTPLERLMREVGITQPDIL